MTLRSRLKKIHILTGFFILFGLLMPPVAHCVDDLAKQVPGAKKLKMSLGECVALAVRNNVSIEVAYLERVLQKYDLTTDTTFRYIPQVAIDGTAVKSEDVVNGSAKRSDKLTGTATVSQKVPTGGVIDFSFVKSREHDIDSGSSTENQVVRTGSWNIQLTQPLMQGGGIDYDLSNLRQAEITEKTNVLNLKETLISTVTDAITYYRSLLEAKHSMEISKQSMDIAQTSLKNAQIEVKYGRMASMDLIQYESDLANRELSLEQAKNSYINARLDLAKLLKLDKNVMIAPSEELDIAPFTLDETKSNELAKANRPDYLTQRLDLEYKEYTLLRASRDTLPELNLTADYGQTDTSTTNQEKTREDDWSVGLELSTPLFGTDRRGLTSTELSAKSELRIAQIQLKKAEDDMISDVADKIRDLKIKSKAVALAERARKLSEQKLQVEQTKLKAGRSSTFQIVTFQSDLFDARNSELTAKIDYLNALNSFDQYLGTTLDTWKIEFKTERPEAEKSVAEVK